MRMFRGYLYLFLLIIASSCANHGAEDYTRLQGSMLGTTYHITARIKDVDNAAINRLLQEIKELNDRMNREMSIFDNTSQLSLINRNESDRLTPWLKENILLADSISALSGGIYDITVAPLVKAWGFAQSSDKVSRPNVDSLMHFVGHSLFTIEGERIAKRDERVQIDLNSIAKGFAVDRLAEIMERNNSLNYIVEIGGEVHAKGDGPSAKGWRVGVESPIDGNMSEGELLERRIEIPADSPLRAMATSGNYRRFFYNDEGEKIVHTIDARSGDSHPSKLLSATVLAPTCALADGYATMFMAAGDDEAEALAAQITNCEVYLIYDDEGEGYREFVSEGMRSMLME